MLTIMYIGNYDNEWILVYDLVVNAHTYLSALSISKRIIEKSLHKMKILYITPPYDTDSDQYTDQEIVIYTKRVIWISLLKNGIRFGWTTKLKVNLLKMLLIYVSNTQNNKNEKK